jgi:penicillin-binding protein 2
VTLRCATNLPTSDPSNQISATMLVFDQLKKNDPQLQLLTIMLCAGLAVLFAGLWWVQIVNAGRYQESLEIQSSRSVRLPAVRGKIFDRNGAVLADNRPSYNINLYLEELSGAFKKEYTRSRPRQVVTNDLPFWKDWLGFTTVTTQYSKLKDDQAQTLTRDSRYRVASAVVSQVAEVLKAPLTLDYTNFYRHYETRRALPYPVASNLSGLHLARFAEQTFNSVGLDLEVQPTRVYPYATTAAHVLGYLRKDDSSAEGEEAFFCYRMPDYRGLVGIEGGFDQQLRGRAGAKSVQVNNLGYRQAENIWSAVEPGQNVVLTLDLKIQQAAEASVRKLLGADAHAAVVVMDVESGDLLALASSPSTDPNNFIRGFSEKELERWHDEELGLQKNRATQEQYQPGSVFKTIVTLAALENGLNKDRLYRVDPNPYNPNRGAIFIGKHMKGDTAPPGDYDLRLAIVRSSNSYFIQVGMLPNVFDRVVELGRRLHLGERIGLPLLQEAKGNFPRAGRERDWNSVYKANICIGQGEMDVTPLQIAVMTCALANGGKVLSPRLVDRLESSEPASIEPPTVYEKGRIRDTLGVSQRSLKILRDAMLAETEAPEGTGKHVLGTGFRICGKTGTAERTEPGAKRNTTWFISFAPYEQPRFAVVVMVENGASGGSTCAPIARDVYLALQHFDQRVVPNPLTTAAQ